MHGGSEAWGCLFNTLVVFLLSSHLPFFLPQVSKLLQYAPQKRMTAVQAMTHPFFDELRDPATRLPNGERGRMTRNRYG